MPFLIRGTGSPFDRETGECEPWLLFLRCAQRTVQSYEVIHMIRKGRVRFAEFIFGLADTVSDIRAHDALAALVYLQQILVGKDAPMMDKLSRLSPV